MAKGKNAMINRCKFINIVLHVCGISNIPCRYMADPHLCCDYDESFNRSYIDHYHGEWGEPGKPAIKKSPAEISIISRAESKRISEEVESLSEFTDRIEAELDGMGIKVVRDIPQTGTPEYMKYWKGLTKEGQEFELARRKDVEKQVKNEVPDWF